MTSGGPKHHDTIALLDADQNNIPPGKIASTINNFFATVGSILDTSLTPWPDPGPTNEAIFTFKPFKLAEVEKQVKSIDTTKSSGIEFLKSSILKTILLHILPEFTTLLNRSITEQIIPPKWKLSQIIPIPKITKAYDPGDYRPIALLAIPGKILERLVVAQSMAYLEQHSLLTNCQDGYRKGRSTLSSTTTLTNHIYHNIEGGWVTSAVFIDFRKAFDCVNHDILVKKISNIGFDKKSTNWFHHYLKDRTQLTLAKGLKSSIKSISCGVPQGSILGPILFLIYLNDLPNIITHSKIQQYADDTVIYYSHRNTQTLTSNLQTDINSLLTWCDRNKMHVNVLKTKQVTFGTSNTRSRYQNKQIFMHDKALEDTPSYKYLGITLDPLLKFNLHVQKTANTGNYRISLFRKIRNMLSPKAAHLVYTATILPQMEYGSLQYCCTNKVLLQELQVIQNSALKCILKLPTLTPTILIHQEAGVKTLMMRYKLLLGGYAFDIAQIKANCITQRLRTRNSQAPVITAPLVRKEIP